MRSGGRSGLRARLGGGGRLVGTFVQTPDPGVGEHVAALGFDFVCVEAEHSPMGRAAVQALVAAIELGGSAPAVRVAGNGAVAVAGALDAGAEAVIVPRVESAEQAAAAVSYARFPPLGARGVGPGRAAGYGRAIGEYLARADDETLLAVQVETAAGVAAAAEIAAVPGVDLVFVGPGDLAASLGVAAGDPALEQAIGAVAAAARAAGRHAGIFAPTADAALRRFDEGFGLVLVGSDLAFLAEGAAAAAALAEPR